MPSVEESVRQAIAGAGDAEPEVRAAAAAAAASAAVPPPTGRGVDTLWTILVSGLVAVLILALGGIIFTIVDGEQTAGADILVTVFSSALTGLIGLFVRSPASG